ncbi:MAG: DUF1501 domain-containing protein, partial [Bacteroidota bacterium]
ALASTSMMVPSFLQGFSSRKMMRSRSGKILIVVQLSGGNDGLNTVVPYQNDIYYQLRPRLAVQSDQVLRLNDDLGLNPVMSGLRDLYEDGNLSIVNSVGYPNPDRSHFRSMDIWHTASDSSEYWQTGWLGRFLDNACDGCDAPYHAIEVDDSLSLAMKGAERNGFAMSNAKQLQKSNRNKFLQAIGQQHHHHDEENVAYLYKTMVDSQSSAKYLYEKSKVYQSSVSYPKTPFGKSLKQIAELITANTDTQIYYASLGGFDTHANQKNQQERLLKQYADGMKALVSDLKKNGLFKDTLIMTFSEFGRRVKQNASSGTDHGTANNLFLIGDGLRKPGIFNQAANLTDLDNGDLKYQIDFRNIYATVLQDWLDAPAPAVLGKRFDTLGLL